LLSSPMLYVVVKVFMQTFCKGDSHILELSETSYSEKEIISCWLYGNDDLREFVGPQFFANLLYVIYRLLSLFWWEMILRYNCIYRLGLNTFLVLIFVVFVADDPHFDRMFKMVLICIECLKWFSFSQFVFYLVFFCNAV